VSQAGSPTPWMCAVRSRHHSWRRNFFGADFSAEDEVRIVSGQIAWFLDCTLVRRLRELTNLRGNRI